MKLQVKQLINLHEWWPDVVWSIRHKAVCGKLEGKNNTFENQLVKETAEDDRVMWAAELQKDSLC